MRLRNPRPHPPFGHLPPQAGEGEPERPGESLMSLSEIKARIPDYAKDLRLNLDSVLSESGAPGLTAKQIGLVALASAIAARHEPLVSAISAEAAKHASPRELDGARTAAAIMAMNNVYYR